MKAKVEWRGEAVFGGVADSWREILMDGPPEYGGKNQGPRPMETVLTRMGGCTVFDVVHILHKGWQEISGCVAEIDATRADTDPKVFTRIHIHFQIVGRGVEPERVICAS